VLFCCLKKAELEEVKHFLFGKHLAAKSPFSFSQTPLNPKPAAPMIGEHSVHVMRALGYDEEEMAALMDPSKAVEKVCVCKHMRSHPPACVNTHLSYHSPTCLR